MTDDGVLLLLEQIDAARADLRLKLDRMPETALEQRPPSGAWSVLENVRHLLFAEQAHIGRLLRERPVWSPLGFTPETMRAARKLPPPSTLGPTLAEVWAAWDVIHRANVARISETRPADAANALTRHLSHLRAHIATIERLVRQLSS